MPVTVVAGVQWGDEGKGRIVDLIASQADIVIRCQGGPNAGHTIVNDKGKFILHGVPSGVFNPKALCIVGAGTVINPSGIVNELKMLAQAGVDLNKVLISERAHLIMPYHILMDKLDEEQRSGKAKIGTTGQGIAWAYSDKVARRGMRAGDLLDMNVFRAKLEQTLIWQNRLLAAYDHPPMSIEDILAEVEPAADFIRPLIGDSVAPIADALDEGKQVMLEGQLGVMRDLDWGAYPFVTSSCPTPAGMAAGAGVSPAKIERIIGVVKAYTTAVGKGPFPTELTDAKGDELRERGGEYGATTKRPRRCGWFDAVAVNWACKVGGFTELALTKIDVLDGEPSLPVCISYKDGNKTVETFPATDAMARVQPVYREMPGWSGKTSEARTMDQLPSQARDYVLDIERMAGVPISMVSVGPERDSIIEREVK